MDYVVFEYPIIELTDNYNELAGIGNTRQDEDISQQSDVDSDSPTYQDFSDGHYYRLRNRQGYYEFNGDNNEGINTGNSKKAGSINRNKSERTIACLRQQVRNLSLRLDKQKLCAKMREEKLKNLYEEELDGIEEDYQKSILHLIQQQKEVRPPLISDIPTESRGTQVSECGAQQAKTSLNSTTVDKACNTIPCDFDNNKDEEMDSLISQAHGLFSRLSNLISRVDNCSAEIKNITKENENRNKNAASAISKSVSAGDTTNKSKSRRYRKRQKLCENMKSPRKESMTTANVDPKILNKPTNIEKKTEKPATTIQQGLIRSNYGDTFLVAGYTPEGSENEDEQGWQTVRPRKLKSFKQSYTEAGAIARAINNPKPRRTQTTQSLYITARTDPKSYAGRLKHGKSVVNSSFTDRTVHSNVSTLASNVQSVKRMEDIMRK